MARSNQVNPLLILLGIGIVLAGIFLSDDEGSAEDPAVMEEYYAQQDASLFPEGVHVIPFSEDFNPGLSSVDELGISIVLALDTSGSMADPPAQGPAIAKHIQANRAVEDIVNFLEDLVRANEGQNIVVKFGLLGFYSQVDTLLPLTEMDAKGFAKLRAALAIPENFEPGGRTAIGNALEKGTEMLAQSGTILRSLVVITDGENTEGPDPEAVMDAIYGNYNSASTKDFSVTTSSTLVSFVGFDIDTTVFEGLHTRGARLTAAADQEELLKSLQEVFLADITKLEAGNQ